MGIPSPRKLFWVIEIQGAYVRFEGIRISQPKGCPTPFETEKAAQNASRHISVGELHWVVLKRVPRAWLEKVSAGEVKIKMKTYQPIQS